jgi:ParB family chromosome partitioning protein
MRSQRKAAKRWLKGHGNDETTAPGKAPLLVRDLNSTIRDVFGNEKLSLVGTVVTGGSLMQNKSRLGRGLDALLSGADDGAAGATLSQVSVEAIDRNPYQPRKEFDADSLAALRDSIKAHGVLQPLVVRQVEGRYQLIAGERRLRAAKEAGLSTVPVTVVDFNDQQVLEATLVENIQREDLNPIEKAVGFKDYLDRFQMTHDQLAARLGLSRSTITNLVALLDLPPEVQNAVRVGQLSTGHAKVLKGVSDPARQSAVAREAVARGLSVHATEALLRQPPTATEQTVPERPAYKTPPEKTTHVQGIEDELRQKLGVRLEIRVKSKEKGQFVLHFESNDDFERLVEVLRR